MESEKFHRGHVFRIVIGIIALASLMAGGAEAALQAVGPISTIHGFPTWYQDTTGLALQPCLGVNSDGTGLADPNCILPLAGEEINFNPTLPISFPNNFPSESFYWIADADMLTIGSVGAKVTFREVLEGAFASPAPAAGQHIVFLRTNMRVSKVGGIDGLTPNSVYTVTHPFGTFTCNTDALGDISACTDPNGNGGGGAQAFITEDGAFAPPLTAITAASFLSAPTTNIGPFLKAVSPPPPAGYIGNPAVLQTIQPGPNGAIFSISGPDVGGPGINTVSTALWSVAGKIAVIDTVPPVIGATSPAAVTIGAVNIPATVNITDNLFVGSVTIDIGPIGNEFTSTINGAGAGTLSPATGSGTFTINTTANTLSFNINIAGLLGTETAAHIHVPLQPAFNLPLGASKVGDCSSLNPCWNYPEALEPDILAGNAFVQIHTTLFPAGEIAGKILPASNVVNMVPVAIDPVTKSGLWGVVIPSATRLGTFNLPITASDGSNPVTGNFVLTVAPLLNSVVVTPTTANILVGSTQALSATALTAELTAIVPQPPIIWSSSNNAVATVDATGVVTGVSPGTATITASTTLDGTTRTNTSTITVVQLTSVGVAPAAVTLATGGTQQLTASPLDQTGAPFVGATVIWSSSNPDAATVSATGLVTAVAPGTATITATATSGPVSVSGTSIITVIPSGGGGGGGGCGGGGGGRVITVDDSGGANYTRIQDAIDNASAGDTILVYSGTYYENVNVNKQLILRGSCTGKPVVDGGGNARAITISADGVMLEGFKAMNAPYLYGSGTGIYVQSNNNTIKNNTVSDNNYAGIFLASASYYSDIVNNTLSYNIVSNNGIGIYLYYSSNNVLIGNSVNSNNDGIVLWPSNNNKLIKNTINSNGLDGISLGYSSGNVIVRNTASNNPIGISLDFSSNNNLIYNNFFNNINNVLSADTINTWNITKTPRTNIIGGPYLGGNFWANPGGTGFSQNCTDADRDGICDSPYILNSNNIDFLPLTYRDNTPSASITNLTNVSFAKNYINWTWTDPKDSDFANVSVWIDNIFKEDVSKGVQFYNTSGFAPDTEHTISTRTVDTNGNINQTWVNHTAKTATVLTPTIKIYTDKTNYSTGDIMNVGLNLTNPGSATRVGLYIWIDLPSGGKKVIVSYPSVTLPAGLNYKKYPWMSITLPSIPPGNYAWHAVLKDTSGNIISESTAPWTFSSTIAGTETLDKTIQGVAKDLDLNADAEVSQWV